VPEFATLVPTSENLALVIEGRLRENWKKGFPTLDNVRLHETRRNRFDLRP
jgi:6-pyruvoyl tetrahydropterin synthase